MNNEWEFDHIALKQARLKKNWSQRQLAEKITHVDKNGGVTERTYRNWEKSYTAPPEFVIAQLEEYLEVNLRKPIQANDKKRPKGLFPDLICDSLHSMIPPKYFYYDTQDTVLDHLLKDKPKIPNYCSYQAKHQNWINLCNDPGYQANNSSIAFLSNNVSNLLAPINDNLANTNLISLGPGDGKKDLLILRHLSKFHSHSNVPLYYPCDASLPMLHATARSIKEGGIPVSMVWFKSHFSQLPLFSSVYNEHQYPNLFSFLGNTLGNLPEEETMRSINKAMNLGDSLILEVRIQDWSSQPKAKTAAEGDLHKRADFHIEPLKYFSRECYSKNISFDWSHSCSISDIPCTETISISYKNYPMTLLGSSEIDFYFRALERENALPSGISHESGSTPSRKDDAISLRLENVELSRIRFYDLNQLTTWLKQKGFEILSQQTIGESLSKLAVFLLKKEKNIF